MPSGFVFPFRTYIFQKDTTVIEPTAAKRKDFDQKAQKGKKKKKNARGL
jgi:hypothetical protein